MLTEDYLIPSSYKPGSSVLSVRIKTHSSEYKNPIILLHGKALPYELNWDYASDDQSFADILAKKDCTVIMLNATGFGTSTKYDEILVPPVKDNYINTYEDFYRDILDLLLWLKLKKSIVLPTLVGWSASVVPTMVIAANNPELISNLVCYGQMNLLKENLANNKDENFYNYEIIIPDEFIVRRNMYLTGDIKESIFPTTWQDKWKNDLTKLKPIIHNGCMVQNIKVYNNNVNLENYFRYEDIKCPILYLYGELDILAQRKFDNFLSKISSNYKEVKFVPSGTHFTMLELNRELLAVILKQHTRIE